MPRRTPIAVAAVLAVAGFVLATLLAREHAQAHAGIASFCAINDVVNCDRVATSPFSVFLGMPVAVWGMFGYGLAAILALAGLRRDRPTAGFPAGLLLALAAFASALAVVLALVSELLVGALCLLCAGSWAVSFALLAAAGRACRPGGIGAALRSDLAVLARRRLAAAGAVAALVAAVLLVRGVYPRYWVRRAVARAVPGPASLEPAGGGSVADAGSSRGPLVVVEFSDYECPFCARVHDETKQLLAGRGDVKLVRRHFPLDSECNSAMKRRMHPGACEAAKAGICAEEQGKSAAMDDALFRNQKAKLPVADLAEQVGLDLPRFKACLGAPGTARRLQADIDAALVVGLRATPTFVVGGRAYEGMLPAEALPPAKAPPKSAGG